MNTLSVGGILGRSFSIWIRNFIPFTIVATIMVIQALTMGSQAESMDEVTSYLIAVGVYIVLAGTLQAVTSAVVYHDLRAIKEGVATEELARVFD